jgi:hypothetical protein
LNHHFLDLAKVPLWDGQKVKNYFAGPVVPFNHRFIDLDRLILDGHKAENVFACQGDQLKHRFLNNAQVAI